MDAPRTRTPPDVKWLANELAATAGELERIDVELARLQERRARLAVTHSAMSQVAGQLAYPQLPDVVPAVKAHRGYGKRGVLRGWLKELLQGALPQAVDTTTMMRMAETAFGLAFSTPRARDCYRKNSLTRQLRVLFEQGLVERLHLPDGGGTGGTGGVWRWKAEMSTLDALRGRS